MRILIVSDTHGRHTNLRNVLTRVGQINMLIHCGDVEDGEDEIRRLVDCEVHMVRGNNDSFSSLPAEDEFWVGDHRVFLTHGHRYHVGFGTEELRDTGVDRGAEIVMFGHTHQPLIDQTGPVTLINPGSISQPRQDGRRPTFIMMEIDRFGMAHYALNYL